MSMNLPVVSLASLPVGASGRIKLPIPGMTNPLSHGDPAHIRLFNESGSGLSVTFSDGNQDTIPAGGWPTYPISPTVTEIVWSILYNVQGPLVTQLFPVYYYPGEEVPPIPVLGNSPIGGAVTTTSIQTLSNEGNSQTPGQVVIDIGGTTVQQLIVIRNDGSCDFFVLKGGVGVRVFTINSTDPAAMTLFNVALKNPTLQSAGGNNYGLLAGTISRMVVDGPFQIRSAGTLINHTLGVIPDLMLPISDTGNIGSAGYYGVMMGSMTATQATLFCSNDNAGVGTRTWIMSFKA